MQIHSVLKKSVIATGVAVALASSGAQAISAGTDLNLSAKAAAGGMAGAAYTMPQEASAAVFGNPATLTQFKGFNMNFGASLISLAGVENVQKSTIDSGALAGSYSNTSTSDADNYIIPDFGMTLEVAPGLVIGTGLEVDAGLGVDMRDSPVTLLAGAAGTELPLLVEVISFNANLAGAYQVSEKLSVGAALTIGFGLAQLGTSGPATLLGPGSGDAYDLTNFGGTTSSVHDIGFGASLGATYLVADGIMTSVALKSPVEYNFREIIHDNVAGYQTLQIQQPFEAIVGVALDGVIMPNLLVEADVIWKQWSQANAYQDAYDDQFLIVIGSQYTMGAWKFRLGYSWAQEILKDTPNNTIGGIDGLGSIGLGPNEAAPDLGVDVLTIVQNTLLPTLWQHTITAGVGYNFTESVRVDAYAAYAFAETEKDNLATLAGTLDAVLAPAAAEGISISNESDIDYELMVGVGINIAMP